jgi:RHS repeat-associated protein
VSARADIGNRKSTTRDAQSANYTPNTLNQYTSRTVPGFVNVLGTATNTATVSLWSKDSTALFTPTTRKGDYFRGEVPFNSSTGAMWLTITNVAALSNYTGADIVTNFVGNSLLAKTPEAFLYDADGNLTNDSLWAYTWDAENRLIKQESVSSLPAAGKQRLDFEYDHQSRRIQKLVSTNNGSGYVAQSTNRFVYDGWNLLAILNPQSSILQSFMWGLDLSGSLQGAGGVGGLLMLTDQTTINGQPSTHFVSYDGNGNVSALVAAASGTVSATYEYGPFSEVVRQTGPMAKANKFRFSTKYQDDESDYLYYGYRSYNPATGRWLSRDPIGENVSANIYALVNNRPISTIDVLGLYLYPGVWPGSPNPPIPPRPLPPPLPPDPIEDPSLRNPTNAWKVCCRSVRYNNKEDPFFVAILACCATHCDFRQDPYPCDPGSKQYPIHPIGRIEDMSACLYDERPGAGGWGNNCQTGTMNAIKKCGGWSPWKPDVYAYPASPGRPPTWPSY